MTPLIGIVDAAGKAFTVSGMTTTEELHLLRLLRQLYEKQNGSPYARVKDMLEEMPAEYRAAAVAELTRTKIAGALPSVDAQELARVTPEGVSLELFMRAKKHHPDLRQEEVTALITSVNAMAVAAQIQAVLTPEEPNRPKS